MSKIGNEVNLINKYLKLNVLSVNGLIVIE